MFLFSYVSVNAANLSSRFEFLDLSQQLVPVILALRHNRESIKIRD